MPPTHFLLCLLSVLGEGYNALLTWVQWSVAYFISLNKTNFSLFCRISYQIESFVFTCCLVSFQEFFLLETSQDTQGSVVCGRLRLKVEDSLLFLPSIVQHPVRSGPWPHWPRVQPGTNVLLQRCGTGAPSSGFTIAACWMEEETRSFERVGVPWSSAFCVVPVKAGWRISGDASLPHTMCVTCEMVDYICILGGYPIGYSPELI